jgi:hypothetical protein
MALSDHSLLPVHAHINLLGWASMALFGLIGTVHPSITKRRVAAAQFCSAIPCSLANDDTDLLNGGNICRKIASLRSAGY